MTYTCDCGGTGSCVICHGETWPGPESCPECHGSGICPWCRKEAADA